MIMMLAGLVEPLAIMPHSMHSVPMQRSPLSLSAMVHDWPITTAWFQCAAKPAVAQGGNAQALPGPKSTCMMQQVLQAR